MPFYLIKIIQAWLHEPYRKYTILSVADLSINTRRFVIIFKGQGDKKWRNYLYWR